MRTKTRIFMACLAAAAPLTSAMAQAAPAAAGSATASQTASAPALTLLEAYRLALTQDAIIRTARAGADARRERIPQARSQLLPNIGFQAGANRNNLIRTQPDIAGVPKTTEQFYDSNSRTFILRQPLFRPALWADYRQAKAQVADANASLEKETQNLATRVTSAYMEALLAEDQRALVLQQQTSYRTQLDAAKKRFAGGAGVRTDIDEAQARLDLAIAHLLEANQNVEYTRRQLQVIINQPVTKLAPIDEVKLRQAPQPGSLEDWRERAELTSPELISLKAQRDAARAEYDKALAGHLPTFDGIVQWNMSKSDSINTVGTSYNSKSVGVQLNVPIFSGGLTSSQVRQTVADIERAEQALEATRRDLGLRVEKEYRGVTEGTLSIVALETAARSADVMVTSNRRSFEGGARTLLDVLNAEEQRLTALRDLANARYGAVLSRIRLKALAGVADEDAIAEANNWLKP
ncbi:TolC family outer membrane protein [Caenimonas koreensis]|uniref:TolC family outer membrane protein n=1 Tax=Caenimonas koreensis TaxID=367474 RepID=UPI00378494DC